MKNTMKNTITSNTAVTYGYNNLPKMRSLYVENVLRILAKAKICEQVDIKISCKVKDLKVLNELKAQKAFITNSKACLALEAADADTSVSLTVAKAF